MMVSLSSGKARMTTRYHDGGFKAFYRFRRPGMQKRRQNRTKYGDNRTDIYLRMSFSQNRQPLLRDMRYSRAAAIG
jgi:hypothetical protein